MDRLVETILNGDLNTTSLLLLFILGILTKRFVPWWVHEDALDKLEQYEQSAPELLDAIDTLTDVLNDPGVRAALRDKERILDDLPVADKSDELRRVVRKQRRRISHAERGR